MKPPKGHVARSIADGKRPFLTVTVAPETFAALDALAARLNVSRGKALDRVLADLSDLAAAE